MEGVAAVETGGKQQTSEYLSATKWHRCQHPYGMLSSAPGFSHGLKTCHRHVFAPVYALVPAFRIPLSPEKRSTLLKVLLFLAKLP